MQPKVKYLAVIPSLNGLSVCTISELGDTCGPELYPNKSQWYEEQAAQIREEADQVENMTREPSEVGTDEELVMVLVYEDGRIIDACDLVTDYRKLFEKDNTS